VSRFWGFPGAFVPHHQLIYLCGLGQSLITNSSAQTLKKWVSRGHHQHQKSPKILDHYGTHTHAHTDICNPPAALLAALVSTLPFLAPAAKRGRGNCTQQAGGWAARKCGATAKRVADMGEMDEKGKGTQGVWRMRRRRETMDASRAEILGPGPSGNAHTRA